MSPQPPILVVPGVLEFSRSLPMKTAGRMAGHGLLRTHRRRQSNLTLLKKFMHIRRVYGALYMSHDFRRLPDFVLKIHLSIAMRRLTGPIVAFISLFNLSLGTATGSSSASAVVDLGYAKYEGVPIRDHVTNAAHTQFLGIRYAAPPTGMRTVFIFFVWK